tara:strand:- start:1319 stop:2242 length:924 start_codon:yes stop_codon:yes gene_type:complete
MNNNVLTVIILSYYSESRINKNYKTIKDRFEKEKIAFELIIIDDGSKDNSYNESLELEKIDNRVKSYQLSKNYTSHYSVFAGFSVSKGACAVAIPDDFQVPLDTIVEMYRQWENGYKIIIPYRDIRHDSFVSRLFSGFYYKIMNAFTEITFPKGGADIFLADREIVDILNEHIHPKNTSTIAEVLRLGFDPLFIPMERPKGVNKKSRWSFKKKIRLAMDTFFSSSSFPIKFISIVGIGSFFLSIVLILTYVYAKLIGYIMIPGWTLLVIYISFFSGLILLSLGIIAEYIWRIFDEVKGRPGFIIKKK